MDATRHTLADADSRGRAIIAGGATKCAGRIAERECHFRLLEKSKKRQHARPMEPLTALDASPELIWVVGVLALGITLGLVALGAHYFTARSRSHRDRATQRNYVQDNGKK